MVANSWTISVVNIGLVEIWESRGTLREASQRNLCLFILSNIESYSVNELVVNDKSLFESERSGPFQRDTSEELSNSETEDRDAPSRAGSEAPKQTGFGRAGSEAHTPPYEQTERKTELTGKVSESRVGRPRFIRLLELLLMTYAFCYHFKLDDPLIRKKRTLSRT
ncbi:hypothetical protein Scep_004455 [Stephania cephalantha]|uniref:Uncharacterized protein n=1 Tax=Stephania cephalantha TaxID=152367 RepID=A0AAP0KSH9_9MAGN